MTIGTPVMVYLGSTKGIFPNSRITATTRFTEEGPGKAGTIMTVAFELDGRPFVALNGGPHHKFTDAISLVVPCDSQAEIDELWAKLGL